MRWGHMYQNLTVMDELNRMEFGSTYDESIVKQFSEVPEDIVAQYCKTDSIGLTKQVSVFVDLVQYLSKSDKVNKKASRDLKFYRERCSALETIAGDTLLNPEKEMIRLYNLFNATQKEFIEFNVSYIDINVYVSVFHGLVSELAGDLDPTVLAEILVGLGDVITADMNRELTKLSITALNDPFCVEFFQDDSSILTNWSEWENVLADTEFCLLLKNFIQNFGYRAVNELEGASLRWKENPTYLLEIISTYIAINHGNNNEHLIDEILPPIEILIEKRKNAVSKILSSCSFIKRPMVSWVLKKVQDFTRHRENLKDVLVRFISAQRNCFMRLSNYLVESGVYSDVEDIYHLEVDDMRIFFDAFIENQNFSDESIRDLNFKIKSNKSSYRRWSGIKAPKIFLGNTPMISEQKDLVLNEEGQIVLRGTPGSPGISSGIACVLNTPHDAAILQSQQTEDGKILVAKATDPAWTPLFLLVNGVVVESGGTLSHSAIVAREFGIPCVLSVSELFEVIETGDFIHIDGSKGIVIVVKQDR